MAAFEAWLVFLILVVNVVGELQRKRTLAASRGFLAAARLSCYYYYYLVRRHCHDVLLGDVAVSLSDAGGRDVAIETVDNGNGTFDVAFVPESCGEYVARVFFAGTEVPDSPFIVNVQPRLPVDQSGALSQSRDHHGHVTSGLNKRH